MKNYFFTLGMTIGIFGFAQAQEIATNAIGLRLGGGDGFGSEISYQRKLEKSNRIEGNLGWNNSNDFDAIKLTGIYQWVWNIDDGFNWYAGPGAGIETWNSTHNNSGTFLFITGNVGIEYGFSIPLLISLDFRPEIGGNDYYNDHFNSNLALALKYKF